MVVLFCDLGVRGDTDKEEKLYIAARQPVAFPPYIPWKPPISKETEVHNKESSQNMENLNF